MTRRVKCGARGARAGTGDSDDDDDFVDERNDATDEDDSDETAAFAEMAHAAARRACFALGQVGLWRQRRSSNGEELRDASSDLLIAVARRPRLRVASPRRGLLVTLENKPAAAHRSSSLLLLIARTGESPLWPPSGLGFLLRPRAHTINSQQHDTHHGALPYRARHNVRARSRGAAARRAATGERGAARGGAARGARAWRRASVGALPGRWGDGRASCAHDARPSRSRVLLLVP